MNRPRRRDRMIRERVHDTYKLRKKPSGESWCPDCGVVFLKGRWAWGDKPAAATNLVCPACQRVRDKCPAGFVRLEGDYFGAHQQELSMLIKNVEALAKGEHPLNRIMSVETDESHTMIHTTDAHLARAIGEALHRAHAGELDFAYIDESPMLRVTWRR